MSKARVAGVLEQAVRVLQEYGIRFEIRDGDIYYVGGDAIKVARLCREGKIKLGFLCD
ncbi:MAG: hypothetical protein GSR86_02060 [Desulfurococcales archaeon]|nr:hypothetical protein [Desulfurococcales archaeon]